MTRTGFPMCCGAEIVHSFTNAHYTGTPEEKKQQAIRDLRNQVSTSYGVAIAIINNTQYPFWWPILKSEGWRCVSATTNPAHSHDTTCFVVVKNISTNPKPIKKS